MEAVAKTKELEDFGVLTEEWKEETPTYNLKAMFEYCARVGKRPAKLSDLERAQFRTK